MSLHLTISALRITTVLIASVSVAGEFEGRVVDSRTGDPLAARIYLEGPAGRWHFVEPADHAMGHAQPYQEQWVPMPGSVERHTIVSPHPFRVELAPGEITA